MVKLHKITLAFPDKREELLFQKAFFEESLPITRVALLLAAFLYGFFGLLDTVFVTEYLHTFLIIRFGVVVPILIAVIILSLTKFFFLIWQQVLFIAFLVGGGGITYMIGMTPENWSYYGGLMLIFSVGYFFARLSFIYATLGGWLNLLLFNLMMYFVADIQPQLFIAFNFFFVSANLIGMFGSYYLELSGRRNFYLSRLLDQKQKDLEQVNLGLESAVEDRTRELKESEEKYRLIFERSPVGVFHFNDKWIVTECNDQFANIIGLPRSVAEGMSLKELSDKRVVDAVGQVLKGNKASFEGRYKAKGKGKGTPVRILFAPIKTDMNKTSGGIGLVEDRREFLEKQQLEKQIAVARESVQFKQKFLANMSHEIRTPLTGIIGMIDILSQTRLNKEQKEYFGTLKLTSENLREIINQILDYSKIEAGRVTIKPRGFNFYELINNAQKLFESLCPPDVNLIVIIDPQVPEFIKADDHRVAQIINNLLNNAIKFTKKGSIELLALPEKWLADGTLLLRIEVTDTGEGIHPEKIDQLFKPFSQLEHLDNKNFEGTGLGLSIAKELTDLMGGEIGVISQQGSGSTFWFNFQARIISREDIKKNLELSGVKDTGPLRILYAEDKIVNQKVVNIMLASLGHEVTLVNDGKQALEIFEPNAFDMILMDIQMPVMDGVTATRKLRAKYKELPPIVGLSANAFEGDKEKYLSMGLDEYLTKPVKKEDFILLLQKLTNK
ncbi:MAG: response regulator [Bacteroidetes bacterium]|nr:MAG: response regulator [Bacteroidota bacterium]